jgi:hypothetical protein
MVTDYETIKCHVPSNLESYAMCFVVYDVYINSIFKSVLQHLILDNGDYKSTWITCCSYMPWLYIFICGESI